MSHTTLTQSLAQLSGSAAIMSDFEYACVAMSNLGGRKALHSVMCRKLFMR